MQRRTCVQMPTLPDTEDELLKALQRTLRKASDDSILQNPPHEAFYYVKKTSPPADAQAIRGALAIVGGEKNQHRSKERKHFLRADGAWFDFTITLARTARGPLVLLAYDFELRFPGPHPPAWIRIDLNLPGHTTTRRACARICTLGTTTCRLPLRCSARSSCSTCACMASVAARSRAARAVTRSMRSTWGDASSGGPPSPPARPFGSCSARGR